MKNNEQLIISTIENKIAEFDDSVNWWLARSKDKNISATERKEAGMAYEAYVVRAVAVMETLKDVKRALKDNS